MLRWPEQGRRCPYPAAHSPGLCGVPFPGPQAKGGPDSWNQERGGQVSRPWAVWEGGN